MGLAWSQRNICIIAKWVADLFNMNAGHHAGFDHDSCCIGKPEGKGVRFDMTRIESISPSDSRHTLGQANTPLHAHHRPPLLNRCLSLLPTRLQSLLQACKECQIQ